jgi:hypothetical protein
MRAGRAGDRIGVGIAAFDDFAIIASRVGFLSHWLSPKLSVSVRTHAGTMM